MSHGCASVEHTRARQDERARAHGGKTPHERRETANDRHERRGAVDRFRQSTGHDQRVDLAA
jgi:hypothetical protein